ncbi:MAG: AAA family ATPase [Chloroflexi bacterium]|nr:AAA family ATPase [Chloroflexota bacterium]MBI3762821.1 AAA family ATPase [Chloroflexota bacterium]
MNRLSSGIPGLDAMLSGGFLPNSAILVRGAPGTGKTTLAFHFLIHGAAQQSEPGLMISFEEFPQSLYRDADSLGFDLRALEKTGGLTMQFTSPEVFLAGLQTPDSPLIRTIQEKNIRRVALDSATQFTRLTEDGQELRKDYHMLASALKREGVTAMLLGEETQAETRALEKGRLAFIADCMIMLRYLEIDSAIQRAVLVLKMRGSSHAKDIRRYEIKRGGIVVGEPFAGREGLLSGIARKSMISTVR